MTRPRSSLCDSSHQRASHLDAGWFHRLLTYDICAFALIVFVFGALHLYACVTLHHITSLHITHCTLNIAHCTLHITHYTLHITHYIALHYITSPYITLHHIVLHYIALHYHHCTTTRACVRACVRASRAFIARLFLVPRPPHAPTRGGRWEKNTSMFKMSRARTISFPGTFALGSWAAHATCARPSGGRAASTASPRCRK